MKKVFEAIKKWLSNQYDFIFNPETLREVPQELLSILKKTKNWCFLFIPVIILAFIFTQFNFMILSGCLLVELMLIWNYLNVKKYIVNKEYTIVNGIVKHIEAPWYQGGKLNKSQKTNNKILVLEVPYTRQMIKCALNNNVPANIEKGSEVLIYAKDQYLNEDGILMVVSYFTIQNVSKENDLEEILED